MNQLKQCSKDFYKWIDDIKRAFRHKAELEEKLNYYESRLVSYNAVTYDSIGSGSNRNHVEDKLLFVIDKIDGVKHRIKKANQKIEEYNVLWKVLSEQEKTLLKYLIKTKFSISKISSVMKLSRSRINQKSHKIAKEYNKKIYSIY